MQRSPEARVRKLVAERLAAQNAARKVLLRGEATVLESALVRGGLTAIYWLSPPGYPWKIFGDMSEALHWAQAQLTRLPGEPAPMKSPSSRFPCE